MKRFATSGFSLLVVAVAYGLLSSTATAADAAGCKDYFVTRLAGYDLWQCDDKDFDSFAFAEGTDKETKVDGRIVDNWYRLPDDAKPNSKAIVRRNYENALKQAGWTVVYSDDDLLTEKQTVGGQERWVQLASNDGASYELRVAQKGAMEQSVTTAADMSSALKKDGRVTLQINFDTGKATIKPDSQSIVDQIVQLLRDDSTLKLSIEGHTDNVGDAASNKTLSDARAKSVVAAIVAKGIAAGRLTSIGYGQDKPIADNSTEQGRAKNRRVELVKQ
jgi:outer membrane protein OmpA-like peptidoglycan-associated protein